MACSPAHSLWPPIWLHSKMSTSILVFHSPQFFARLSLANPLSVCLETSMLELSGSGCLIYSQDVFNPILLIPTLVLSSLHVLIRISLSDTTHGYPTFIIFFKHLNRNVSARKFNVCIFKLNQIFILRLLHLTLSQD